MLGWIAVGGIQFFGRAAGGAEAAFHPRGPRAHLPKFFGAFDFGVSAGRDQLGQIAHPLQDEHRILAVAAALLQRQDGLG